MYFLMVKTILGSFSKSRLFPFPLPVPGVVVPGVVDNRRTVELGSSLIAAYPEVRYKLIKFRHYGVREEYQKIQEPSDEEMEALRELAKGNGVKEIMIT